MFLNQKLNKICVVMKSSFELNTYLFFTEQRFISVLLCSQTILLNSIFSILSFEKFCKNLHWNLKLIFLFSMLFVRFEISYRQSFITYNFFFWFMNLMLSFLYMVVFFIQQCRLWKSYMQTFSRQDLLWFASCVSCFID